MNTPLPTVPNDPRFSVPDERLILVDAQDRELGEGTKYEAHVHGLMHRAFSIFVVNSAGEILLQQRALSKYHSPGLWTNTCCGHPRPGETVREAGMRRLHEEMGFSCSVEPLLSFTYHATFADGLIEHEYDHVLLGRYDDSPLAPNPSEVADWKWVTLDALATDVATNAAAYTVWFKRCLPDVLELLRA